MCGGKHMCLEFGIEQSEDLLLNFPGVEHGWKPVEDEIVFTFIIFFLSTKTHLYNHVLSTVESQN